MMLLISLALTIHADVVDALAVLRARLSWDQEALALPVATEIIGANGGRVFAEAVSKSGRNWLAGTRRFAVGADWTHRWTATEVFTVIARANPVASSGAIHPQAVQAMGFPAAAVNARFVSILDSVVTTDANSFPAISVRTIGVDVARTLT